MVSLENFKSVISEWLNLEIPSLKEREIKLPVEPSVIISVVGGRRCGKTYTLFNTIEKLIKTSEAKKDEILYIDFEHPQLKGVKLEDLDNMLIAFNEITGKNPKYVFLDEIQNVKDFGKWFRRFYKFKVYISGSSSELTSKKISDELRGRSVDYTIFPLSFREYLNFIEFKSDLRTIKYTVERGKILSILKNYLKFGSYPAIALEEGKNNKIKLIKSYFNSIIVRDFDIVRTSIAETFCNFIISSYSTLTSINRIYNYLRSFGYEIGKEKVIELFNRSFDVFFSFFVEIFNKSERVRKANPKKVYLIDTSYPTALGYEFSISRAMENSVLIELLRKEKNVYYWKEYGKREGLEVDFVISKNFVVKQLIQVTYASSKDEIENREIKSLVKAGELFKKHKPELMIITWDYEDELKIDNKIIKCIPLWEWLLWES